MTNVETIGTQLEELEKKKQYEEGKLAQHSEELKQLEVCNMASCCPRKFQLETRDVL